MTQQIATDPSQSARLIQCGVDPKSADFVWMDDKPNNPRLTLRTEIIEDSNPYIVAVGWSLGRILALSPKIIICDAYGYIWLEIVWLYEENSIPTIRYFTPPNENDDESDQWEFTDESIIECAVQAVEWIKDNGYKLNTI